MSFEESKCSPIQSSGSILDQGIDGPIVISPLSRPVDLIENAFGPLCERGAPVRIAPQLFNRISQVSRPSRFKITNRVSVEVVFDRMKTRGNRWYAQCSVLKEFDR